MKQMHFNRKSNNQSNIMEEQSESLPFFGDDINSSISVILMNFNQLNQDFSDFAAAYFTKIEKFHLRNRGYKLNEKMKDAFFIYFCNPPVFSRTGFLWDHINEVEESGCMDIILNQTPQIVIDLLNFYAENYDRLEAVVLNH